MDNKFILDACCGPRMFWFNKHHPNCLYIDNRIREKGYIDNRPNREVKPDVIMDFRNMDFEDKSFKLIAWDPPHLKALQESSRMHKSYGCLNAITWQGDLKCGFEECWRVLDDYGVLIFKWNEFDIPLKKILKLFHTQPLFGHSTGTKERTKWMCFMKIPKSTPNLQRTNQ